MAAAAAYEKFSNLSTFERLLIVHSDMTANIDGTVSAARTQMKSTQLPTYFVDIFRRSVLDDAKALFSPEYKRDPTPGFGFSALGRQCEHTLEGYFVDKHLSSSISSGFMIEVLTRIERAVNENLQRVEGTVDRSYRDTFYSHSIQSFGINGDNFVANFRELNVEVNFMFRVVDRLCVQEAAKLYTELPLPQFKNPKYLEALQRSIARVQKDPASSMLYCLISNKEPDDLRLYGEYRTKLYDTRDRRVLQILKDAWQKDLAARQTNPKAPLKHLVTIEKYEKAISLERLKLTGKIALAVFTFFFASACFVVLRTRWQA